MRKTINLIVLLIVVFCIGIAFTTHYYNQYKKKSQIDSIMVKDTLITDSIIVDTINISVENTIN